MLADHLEDCPAEFKELPVVFSAGWVGYEECGWIVVFDFLGELMVCEGGYSVMAENNEFFFDPTPYDPFYERFSPTSQRKFRNLGY